MFFYSHLFFIDVTHSRDHAELGCASLIAKKPTVAQIWSVKDKVTQKSLKSLYRLYFWS